LKIFSSKAADKSGDGREEREIRTRYFKRTAPLKDQDARRGRDAFRAPSGIPDAWSRLAGSEGEARMKFQISDPADLERIGRLVFGEQWQSAMRAYLGIPHDTLRRWIFGVTRLPEWVARGISQDLTSVLDRSLTPKALTGETRTLLWLHTHPGYRKLPEIARGLEASPAATEDFLRTLLNQGYVRVRAEGDELAYATGAPFHPHREEPKE
jgi:hypothetical protein